MSPPLTLRQIEVIRAVMVTGTVTGAARMLNVSAPGISRLMKYTEKSLGVPLFERRLGRHVPSLAAAAVFEQIDAVYKKLEDLRETVGRLGTGEGGELKIAATPSIANVMAPRAIAALKRRHPDLSVDFSVLNLEEGLDYLLLEKGELVAVSGALDHPNLAFIPLARGRLFCVVPPGHPLCAVNGPVTARQMADYPLIGLNPADPYGRIAAGLFEQQGLTWTVAVKARFGVTACRMVQAGLGIAIIDQFTLAHGGAGAVTALEIAEPTGFQTHIAHKADRELSVFANRFVAALKMEMTGSPTV